MNDNKKMSWKDVSIKKYLQIQEIVNDESLSEEDKSILIANTIYGEDITELTLPEYAQKMAALSFMNDAPQNDKFANSYTINGIKYKTSANLESIQANQFIDFQNYAKKEDIIGCISCFFIPDGHKYNDGYDMLKVKEDIGDLPITVANGLAFFFKTQYTILLVLSQRYSLKLMKEMGMSKEKLKMMEDNLAKLGIANLVATLSY